MKINISYSESVDIWSCLLALGFTPLQISALVKMAWSY